jgi:hypothetical protein
VGEPIEVAASGQAPAALMNDVRDRLETMLGIRPEDQAAPGPVAPAPAQEHS